MHHTISKSCSHLEGQAYPVRKQHSSSGSDKTSGRLMRAHFCLHGQQVRLADVALQRHPLLHQPRHSRYTVMVRDLQHGSANDVYAHSIAVSSICCTWITAPCFCAAGMRCQQCCCCSEHAAVVQQCEAFAFMCTVSAAV